MVSKQTKSINATGLHARPASVFVTEAKKYQCNVTIKNVDKDSAPVNDKSIMMILAAGLGTGTQIEIACDGEDEQAALRVIAADDEVDYDFNAIKHTLAQEIAADPGKVDAALDLLMVIKYLERIGDHAVNLAEWVEFVRSGRYHNKNMF